MQDFLHGTGMVLLYYVIAASTAFTCRILTRIPDELFRKGLHFILLGSYPFYLFAFIHWWHPIILAMLLIVVVYPIFMFCERFKNFSRFTTERRQGEFKQSLVLAFTMLSASIAVCWGWLEDKLLVLACMYAWGVGDAFAALIGKPFGRHKLNWKGVDPKKSVEGSAAMFFTSWIAVTVVLLCRGGLPTAGCVLIAAAGAAVCTLVELHTPNGMDTVTCPSAALLTILPLVALVGGSA